MLKYLIGAAVFLTATFGVTADGSRQSATPLIPEGWSDLYKEWGFSPALQIGDTIYVSGMIVHLSGEGTYEERYANGIREVFKLLEKMIAPAGASLDDIIEMTSFHTDIKNQLPTLASVRKGLMKEPHPAWTAVGTTGLATPDGQTEIKFTLMIKPATD